MKRTNLTEKCTFSRRRTGVFSSKTAAFIPAVLIAAAVLAFPLTGCYDDLIEPTAYQTAVTTAAPVYAENSAAVSDSTELPWGVTLQADPSILVPCELERVVDGDTIIVHTPDGTRTRVRLTGINAPESVHPDENQNTEEGKDASQFMKDLLADIDTVYLRRGGRLGRCFCLRCGLVAANKQARENEQWRKEDRGSCPAQER